jgi:hypothetical protein
MPLIDTTIDDILRGAGVKGVTSAAIEGDKRDIRALMEEVGLSDKEMLNQLANIIHNGTNDALRLQGLDKGLKMSGLLSEKPAPPVVPVIINIHDSKAPIGVNPILLPREIINLHGNSDSDAAGFLDSHKE